MAVQQAVVYNGYAHVDGCSNDSHIRRVTTELFWVTGVVLLEHTECERESCYTVSLLALIGVGSHTPDWCLDQ